MCITKIKQDSKPSKEKVLMVWGSGQKIVGSVLIKYFCMFCLYLQPKKKQQQQQQQQNNCKNVTFEHYFTYNFKIFLKLDSIYSVCVGGYLEMPS